MFYQLSYKGSEQIIFKKISRKQIIISSSHFFSGGLFHPGDNNQEIAFRYAVDKINLDRTILPRSKLTTQVEIISPQDSFHASKRG